MGCGQTRPREGAREYLQPEVFYTNVCMSVVEWKARGEISMALQTYSKI